MKCKLCLQNTGHRLLTNYIFTDHKSRWKPLHSSGVKKKKKKDVVVIVKEKKLGKTPHVLLCKEKR